MNSNGKGVSGSVFTILIPRSIVCTHHRIWNIYKRDPFQRFHLIWTRVDRGNVNGRFRISIMFEFEIIMYRKLWAFFCIFRLIRKLFIIVQKNLIDFYIRVYFTLLSNNIISLRMLLDIKTRINLSRYNFIDFNCLCK